MRGSVLQRVHREKERSAAQNSRSTTEVALLYYTALNIDLPTGILIGIMVTRNLGALHHPILIRIIVSGRARSLGLD